MQSRFSEQSLARLEKTGVIAVLTIDDAQNAVPVADALLAGGVDIMELTLRTPAALEAVKLVKENRPEMLAGVGTILTEDQVYLAKEAGADFGVAPGLNPTILQKAQEIDLPFAPGIVTPSEIERAIELGCRELKFFPAEPSGGLKYLKSMAAPYKHLGLRYMPLGGVSQANLEDYIASDLILALGGSWIAPRDLIANHDWNEISARAVAATQVVRKYRK